jgi:hypothetical protein
VLPASGLVRLRVPGMAHGWHTREGQIPIGRHALGSSAREWYWGGPARPARAGTSFLLSSGPRPAPGSGARHGEAVIVVTPDGGAAGVRVRSHGAYFTLMAADPRSVAYVWASGPNFTTVDALGFLRDTDLSSIASRIEPGEPHGLGAGPTGEEVFYVQLLLEGLRFAGDHMIGGATTAAGAGLFGLIVSSLKRLRVKHIRRGAHLYTLVRLRFDDQTELRFNVPDDEEALEALSETVLPKLDGASQLWLLTWDSADKQWRLTRAGWQRRGLSRWERLVQRFQKGRPRLL